MAKEFLYERANRVLAHVPPSEDGTKEVGIEIVLAILQILPMVYQCWKDHKQAAQRVRSPGLRDRLRLRRAVRGQLGTAGYRRHGAAIVEGLLAIGEDATEEDVKKYLEEVQ